jgi:adenylate cyclase
VPQPVYQRLCNRFVFEERGDVDVKGKGVMQTWYLAGRNDQRDRAPQVEKAPQLRA